MVDFCQICGANLAMVGRSHRCVPRVVTASTAPAVKPKPEPRPEPKPEVKSKAGKPPFDRVAYYKA